MSCRLKAALSLTTFQESLEEIVLGAGRGRWEGVLGGRGHVKKTRKLGEAGGAALLPPTPPPLPHPALPSPAATHHRRPQAQSGFGKPKSGLMEPWAGGQAAIDPPLSPRSPSYLSIALWGEGKKGRVGGGSLDSKQVTSWEQGLIQGWSLVWGGGACVRVGVP